MKRERVVHFAFWVTASAWSLAVPFSAGPAHCADRRGYVAGKFAIEVDGVMAGWAHSSEGAFARGVTSEDPVGADGIVHKHLGNVEGSGAISIGVGLSAPFYDWIKAYLDRTFQRKNGAIILASSNYAALSRLEIFQTLISEVSFPALDAASRAEAKIAIKLMPAGTQPQSAASANPPPPCPLKPWKAADFRFSIDGVQLPVTEVDPLAVTLQIPPCDERECSQPPYLEVSNLAVALPEANAQFLYDWYADFVLLGNSGDAQEKSATLEYLDQNGAPLFTLTLSHLGILSVGADVAETRTKLLRRVKAEMYVESVAFDYSASATCNF